MLKYVIIHRSINAVRRAAFWMVVFAASFGWSAVSVSASMISTLDSSSGDWSLALTNETWVSTNLIFDFGIVKVGFVDSGACGSITDHPVVQDRPSVPTSHFERQIIEMLDLGVEVRTTSGANSSTLTGSSTNGETSPVTGAICRSGFELSPAILIGWLVARDVDDIPPAPPFELLRPPKVITILT